METLWRHPDRNKWLGGGADIPGIHSICVDPRNADTVRVAVSCGGMWVTYDAGKTWAQSAHGMKFDDGPSSEVESPDGQDPHMMVQSPADPTRFWVQHHAGIFKSVHLHTASSSPSYSSNEPFGYPIDGCQLRL